MTPPQALTSLAFYLPQFHEIPENDEWWGRGFTEWAQVRPAKSYFDWQRIRRPVEPLGYYNLLEPGVMEAQGRLARAHGIGFFDHLDSGNLVDSFAVGNDNAVLTPGYKGGLSRLARDTPRKFLYLFG